MGLLDRKFVLVDGDRENRVIPEFHWDTFEEERRDWHWYFSQTELTRETVGSFWAYQNRFSFIISNYTDFQIYKNRKELDYKDLDNRRNEVLERCRNHSN